MGNAKPAGSWTPSFMIRALGGPGPLGRCLRRLISLAALIGLLLAGYGVGGLMYSAMVPWILRVLGERALVVAGGALGFIALTAIVLSADWMYTVPCTISLGIAFYLVHNTVQTKATEVAPDSRASAIALYASAWGAGQALGAAAAGAAVVFIGYVPTIAGFGLGFALLGLWLRYNLRRLRPA